MTGPGGLMAAEIAAQPEAVGRLVARRSDVVHSLRARSPRPHAGVVIVARGSSDHAAVFGRYVCEAACGRPVALAAPSLTTLYEVDLNLEGWLAVGVSQSGRTPEIATVLAGYAAKGARTVAVTNESDSPLAEAAELTIELGTGPERAVPATKTVTAQLVVMAMIAEALGPVPWAPDDWEALPAALEAVVADPDPADRAAEALAEAGGVVCVARGYLHCVALEAALKLREAAGMPAEGWSAADYRHGPATTARGDVHLLAITARGPAAADVDALAAHWREGGSRVLRVADERGAELSYERAPAEPLAAVTAIVRAQQLALALGRRRGVDPDRPPQLTKVTLTR